LSLRVITFCVFLAAWLFLAAVAIAGAIPRLRRQAAAPIDLSFPAIVGMLLQAVAALPITLSLTDGPLRPRTLELVGTLALAPFAAALFAWALRSGRRETGAKALVTRGAYAWMRHPIYLAFLAMLLATGFIASAGLKLIVATALYVAGSELRIASEEAELQEQFRDDYGEYRRKTRWRYLPGLR
jgi:protein-S-isoprenylcysteine O-methyltransferase Ste14